MPLPQATDLLQLILNSSLVLAGFAGVVAAISQGGTHKLDPIRRLSLINLLATSFGALFVAFIALALLLTGMEESLVWRLLSGVGIIGAVIFDLYSARTVMRTHGTSRRDVITLTLVSLPLLLVCLTLLWNIFTEGAFWPIFLLLTAYFAIGCFSFIQLLLAPERQ